MFLRVIYHLFVILFALGFFAYFVNGVSVANILTAVIVAFILAIVHILIKPFTQAFHIPINLISLFVISLLLNTLVIWFLGNYNPSFVVATFEAAFVCGFVLTILAWFNNKMID